MSKKATETPLMRQYNEIKAKHPEALLLFRVGDFYETFGSDAVKASKILGIVLTKRKNGAASSVELAGFPHHALDTYLPKLVNSGERVAICDQLEDPKQTKTIVKRGITELVTPGTALNENLLEHRENNFLASVYKASNVWGIALLDVSTGEFFVAQGNAFYIDKLIQSFQPSELLMMRNQQKEASESFDLKLHQFPLEDWCYEINSAEQKIQEHFGTKSLKGFGIDDLKVSIQCAGSIMQYLNQTRHEKISHIHSISRIEHEQYVWLDRFTVRNLEILNSSDPEGKSLLDVMDHSITPMGARMIRRWVGLPLKNHSEVKQRQSFVEMLISKDELRNGLIEVLNHISDLERLLGRLSTGRTSPKEIRVLHSSLENVQQVKSILKKSRLKKFLALADQISDFNKILDRIDEVLSDSPPAMVAKGGVIKEGFSEELDELRGLQNSGKEYLNKLQKRESENTGIPSLKIAFNNVFGYYLEVTNTHKDKVPETWHRKQTLVNSERYITEELKNYEEKILGAEEKILSLETKLFNSLIAEINLDSEAIQKSASQIAKLDCLLSLAILALKNNYTKPKITEGTELEIIQGRHPVIEQALKDEEVYIPNDLFLDNSNQQILMITGPNMSGKSAILRQTALIVLMAQIGSYVPARSAKLGITDKVFTRVGASDNISKGESTFMVEMNETASILNNITDRSLILLDEIGRGTSTFDGISIAWAIAEYLHNHKGKPKTLFATHYHELNEMAEHFEGIKNYNVSIKEIDGNIVFLRKLEPGGSAHSFGIHVARLAGMPRAMLRRAEEVLTALEKEQVQGGLKNKVPLSQEMQLSYFQLDDPTLSQVKDEIMATDIDTLTPVEALLKLHEIKNLLS